MRFIDPLLGAASRTMKWGGTFATVGFLDTMNLSTSLDPSLGNISGEAG